MNYKYTYVIRFITQPAFTCSKPTRETSEQRVIFGSAMRHTSIARTKGFVLGHTNPKRAASKALSLCDMHSFVGHVETWHNRTVLV